MLRIRYLLPVIFMAAAITIGCQRIAVPQPTAASVVDKTVENKLAKLEQDLKKASDDITKLSTQVRQQELRAKEYERERDDLKLLLKERTTERDAVSGKLEGFRKNVRDLLTQMDAAIAQPYKPNPETLSLVPPPGLSTAAK